MSESGVIKGLVVPGMPHLVLTPDANENWRKVRNAYDRARQEVLDSGADVVLVYSTIWPSVVGHQIQANPEPKWVHVDELFHDLGSIPYQFRMDADFANAYREAATNRGLYARTVDYHGFPIDTGSVVALKLLTPNNEIPACIVSSNMYADRAETIVLGKAANDALRKQGKKAVAVVVTHLSNRMFTEFIDPKDDGIHSAKDDEWNRKMLEFLADGRLEDVAQLSREIHRQIRVHKVVSFKPMWWLSAAMGQHNNYVGNVYEYAPIYGVGAAVVSLTPSSDGVGDKEFDEDDVEVYQGNRDVLSGAAGTAAQPVVSNESAGFEAQAEASATSIASPPTPKAPARSSSVRTNPVRTDAAPAPVGAYPHARRVGDLLYLSGIGPRQAGTDAIPGGPVVDQNGQPRDYDVAAQTRACIENIKTILESAGSSLENALDVTVFLIDMDRDFKAFNKVYAEYFQNIGAARTTVEVRALPTPIAVELKVLAAAGEAK